MSDKPKPPIVIVRDMQTHDAADLPDEALQAIQQELLNSAIQHLIDQGVAPDEAKARALAALNAPPAVPLPTFEELDAMEQFPIVRLTEAFEDLPVGAIGTLLDRYPQYGSGTVEFCEPEQRVCSVPLSIIEAVPAEQIIEYDDMTPEQQRIVDAGNEEPIPMPPDIKDGEQWVVWLRSQRNELC